MGSIHVTLKAFETLVEQSKGCSSRRRLEACHGIRDTLDIGLDTASAEARRRLGKDGSLDDDSRY
jgi:hypothetical protein